jgi:hypothetical protein
MAERIAEADAVEKPAELNPASESQHFCLTYWDVFRPPVKKNP